MSDTDVQVLCHIQASCTNLKYKKLCPLIIQGVELYFSLVIIEIPHISVVDTVCIKPLLNTKRCLPIEQGITNHDKSKRCAMHHNSKKTNSQNSATSNVPYLLEYSILSFIPKWPSSTEQNIGYNTYAPNVWLRPRFSFQHFWSNIVGTANNVMELPACIMSLYPHHHMSFSL